ncbi:MAG: VCBS repeat-containing protein [Crocinitomicaceae bacterium]|nr:VCBS repeat-containing protein [Crocinitomicaceae bacterium]
MYFSAIADADNDGDLDVYTTTKLAAGGDNKLAWHENIGGGTFGSQYEISIKADEPTSVFSDDLDGDGDYDLISSSKADDKIAWYENLGNQTFAKQSAISFDVNVAWDVSTADLDNDGDKDILSASFQDSTIAWNENLGGGNFGPQQIILTSVLLNGVKSVYSSDLDNDGDLDILAACSSSDRIAWIENLEEELSVHFS